MADLGIDGDMVSAKGAVSGVESISLNGAKGGEWGADHSGSNILGVAVDHDTDTSDLAAGLFDAGDNLGDRTAGSGEVFDNQNFFAMDKLIVAATENLVSLVVFFRVNT